MNRDLLSDTDGPTGEDLASIETERPLIEAEMALLDAEIRLLTTDHPAALDWRRLRRAEARVCREMAVYLSESTPGRRAGLAA